MRVLVTPLMAMAESAGSATRARALASAMASRGWRATLCVPEGFSGAIPAGVSAQPILTPNPLTRVVEQLRKIIQNERFEAVYSEFNIASIIAAKAEGVPVFGSMSFPTQPSFASDPSSVAGLNRVLRSLSMDPVRSPEDILLMPNVRFVPSCPELEPFPALLSS